MKPLTKVSIIEIPKFIKDPLISFLVLFASLLLVSPALAIKKEARESTLFGYGYERHC